VPKVYIAICSCRDWKPQFGASLFALGKETKVDTFLNSIQGTSVIPKARQKLMEDAINGGFTHILMIDDDMKFPADMLDRLLAHGVSFVGVNYVSKGTKKPVSCGLDGQLFYSSERVGLSEIGWIGFGAVLIELEAIKNMPKPWFEQRWLEERQDFMGEDFYFCMKARTHGLKIYLDNDIECEHIGDYAYRE